MTGTLPTGGNGNYTYQWQSGSNGVNWVSMSGETQTGYFAGVLTQTQYYRRIVTSGICTPNTSVFAEILVTEDITLNTIGTQQTICSNQSPALLLS